MKKLFALTLALLIGTTLQLQAQITHTANGAVDQNAEQILKKAADKMGGSSAVSFTVTMVNKDTNKKEKARQSADVLFFKNKYRVSAADQVLYCNGTSVWHWNKSANEVMLTTLTSSDDDLMNPSKLLANYKQNYKPKFIRQENDGTAVVDLTPKKSKSFYKIRLLINGTNGVLKKMEIHNYDGSEADYMVSNFKSGVKTTESDFAFQATQNPKVEVIDMR